MTANKQALALNQRQLDFCLYYITLGMNATQAYCKAYPDSTPDSAKASACKLLTQDSVSQEIDRLRQEKAQDLKEQAGLTKPFKSQVDHQFIESARLQLLQDDDTPANVRAALLKDLEATVEDVGDGGKMVITWGES